MARASKNRKQPASAPKKAPKKTRGGLMRFALMVMVWGVLAVGAFLLYAARDLPDTSGLAEAARQPSIAYLDRYGDLIGRRGDQQNPVRLEDLPDYLPRAVLAVEDRKFYYHPGVDPFGIARAAIANMRAGAVVQGGSTITQQLAKNLFLTNERTFKRKAQEMVLALWLERKFTKDEILELYLNRVYFGSGAWGVEAASRRYFGKSASQVSLGEAALLAGLLKAPSRYNPSSSVARAEGRATVVLDVMVEAGQITPDEREAAFAAPIVVTRAAAASSAHYFMDWMDIQLRQIVGEVDRDLIVDTTLDLQLQRGAERALSAGLDGDAATRGATQGAVVALDPAGGVMAMAGGKAYDDSQFNRAVQARRQPGSAFKPFVYLAAIEAGLTPDTVRTDAPVEIGDYAPGNYGDKYLGQVTLRTALEESSNSVAVRVAQEVGLDTVAATARRMGITAPLRPEAALALGAQEVTPLDLASAYAPFANGGAGVFPHGVTRVRTPEGEILYERRGSGPGPAMAADDWAVMTDLLEGVVIRGTGRRAQLPGRRVGGKTGTTDEFRDAWFAGFTGGVTAVVWVGNDDYTPMQNVTGGTLPAEIWAGTMGSAPSFDVRAAASPAYDRPAAAAPAATPAEDDPIGGLIARIGEDG